MHTHTPHPIRTAVTALVLAAAALLTTHGPAAAHVLEGTGIDSTWPGTLPAGGVPNTAALGGGPQEF